MATFQVVKSHTWPEATVPDNAALDSLSVIPGSRRIRGEPSIWTIELQPRRPLSELVQDTAPRDTQWRPLLKPLIPTPQRPLAADVLGTLLSDSGTRKHGASPKKLIS